MAEVLRRATYSVLAGLVAVVAGAIAGGGCSSRIPGEPVVGSQPLDAHRRLVSGYFDAVNAAADQGSTAQEKLFAATQHPDFRDLRCSLRGLTLTADPAYSTLHTDPDWSPPLADGPPRGTVYAIAATVTVQRSAEVLGSQIGTLHIVVLDGRAYGFAPCPT